MGVVTSRGAAKYFDNIFGIHQYHFSLTTPLKPSILSKTDHQTSLPRIVDLQACISAIGECSAQNRDAGVQVVKRQVKSYFQSVPMEMDILSSLPCDILHL